MKIFKFLTLAIILSVFLIPTVQADNILKVTATVTAENTFTDPIDAKLTGSRNDTDVGAINFIAYGFGTATVTLQCAYDFGTAWIDMETYTDDTVQTITNYEPGVQFRAGVKTGDYTSGTISLRLSRGK